MKRFMSECGFNCRFAETFTRKINIFIVVMGLFAFTCSNADADQIVNVHNVKEIPVIDGQGDDPIWSLPEPVNVKDAVADIEITLKAVHTSDKLFFLVQFPDPDENRYHKRMKWNKKLGLYQTGPEREDTFVFKWNMELSPRDLTLKSDKSYRADIWYWKAFRTDSIGHADDKMHIYTDRPVKGGTKVHIHQGRFFSLTRPADQGSGTYDVKTYESYISDRVDKFTIQPPAGSRADIKAKGIWKDGRWTIEFGRLLKTGHRDDIQFTIGRQYEFGVSRYEIAGKKKNPAVEQPLYGTGEVGQKLILNFLAD